MALIDVVEWYPKGNDIFAYKYPNSNLSTATQLVVHESQEAVFFSKGQILGKFGPGKHKLTTENLPLLRNLFGIPFGGKNPFIAEVWFVNKTAPLNIDWKTTTMRFMDPDYGQMVPLVAKGRYGLKVTDAERFLVQLVGTLASYTADNLTDHFMGALIAKTNSSIMAYMNANRVGINQIASYLEDLSNFIKQPMSEFWEQYGFALTGFYITEVNLDSTTPEGKKISDALSDRSAQAIAGYTWQQKQSFGVANNAVNNGSQAGIVGMAMMSGGFSSNNGMGNSMLQVPNANQYQMPNQQLSQMVNQQFNQIPNQQFNQMPNQQFYQNNNQFNMANMKPQPHIRAEVFCSNCGKKYPITSRFCPYCGNAYNPCPCCGSDNAKNARRCVTCGATLNMESTIGETCSKCYTPIQPGVKFCPNCGNRI